mmetsp:Transcript_11209/g.16961  ORF Transcript_11209/g.16961 Transcript_11209/m.16961 type:complete len:345 (+) Transcript_11209:277-1311(+)
MLSSTERKRLFHSRHSHRRPLLTGFITALLFFSQCQSLAAFSSEGLDEAMSDHAAEFENRGIDDSAKSNVNVPNNERLLFIRKKSSEEQEGGYAGSTSSSSSSSSGSFFTRGRDSSPSSSSSSRSHYGSSSSYGSYGSPSSSSSSSYSSYSSPRSKYGGSSSSYGSGSGSGSYKYRHEEPMVPLAWVILLVITFVGIGMLITANEFIYNTEGNLANFCRLSVKILDCIWRIIYNCYHCRLSEIPNVVWTAIDDDDDENDGDAYTEEELQRMKLRPGIERALDVEHNRSMNRMKKEFSKNKKTEMGKKIAKKVGVAERGPGLKALMGGEKRTYARVNTEEKEEQA